MIGEGIWFLPEVLFSIPSSRLRDREAESVGNHVPTIINHDMHSSHQGCDSWIENKHDIQKKVILSWADFKKQVIAAYLIIISG